MSSEAIADLTERIAAEIGQKVNAAEKWVICVIIVGLYTPHLLFLLLL